MQTPVESGLVEFLFANETRTEGCLNQLTRLLTEKLKNKKKLVWKGKVALSSQTEPMYVFNVFTQTKVFEVSVSSSLRVLRQVRNGNIILNDHNEQMCEYSCNGLFIRELGVSSMWCPAELQNGDLLFQKDKSTTKYHRVTEATSVLEGSAQRHTQLQDGRIVAASTTEMDTIEVYDSSCHHIETITTGTRFLLNGFVELEPNVLLYAEYDSLRTFDLETKQMSLYMNNINCFSQNKISNKIVVFRLPDNIAIISNGQVEKSIQILPSYTGEPITELEKDLIGFSERDGVGTWNMVTNEVNRFQFPQGGKFVSYIFDNE
jgi:hypothetical protein